jgi:hypothetical protein
MASIFCDSEGSWFVEVAKRCHSQYSAVCADIKEVKKIEFEGFG